MSENRLKPSGAANDSESDMKETTFSENLASTSTKLCASPIQIDTKLEKKVTFARLLNKVSAEMSSGSEVDDLNYYYNITAHNKHAHTLTFLHISTRIYM